jgi:hypothetical protein
MLLLCPKRDATGGKSHYSGVVDTTSGVVGSIGIGVGIGVGIGIGIGMESAFRSGRCW